MCPVLYFAFSGVGWENTELGKEWLLQTGRGGMRSEIACESHKYNVIHPVFGFAFKNSYFAKNEDPIRKLICSIGHSAW